MDSNDGSDGFDSGGMAARTGARNIFGKLDAEIPPIRINSEVLIRLQRNAAGLHLTLSEYVRTRLEVDAVGKEHIMNMHSELLDGVSGNATHDDVRTSTAPVGMPTFLRSATK